MTIKSQIEELKRKRRNFVQKINRKIKKLQSECLHQWVFKKNKEFCNECGRKR